jgi:hypothetical protein
VCGVEAGGGEALLYPRRSLASRFASRSLGSADSSIAEMADKSNGFTATRKSIKPMSRCVARSASSQASRCRRVPGLLAAAIVSDADKSLAGGHEVGQTWIIRPRPAPVAVQQPSDPDQVADGLGRERTRHPSRWRQLRAGVNGELGRCLSGGRS